MKTASALLTSILGSGQFEMADLYTFTLVNGTVLRYTSYDVAIVSGVNTFSATGPLIKRGKTHWKIGLDVDEMDIEVLPHAGDLIGSLTFQQALQQGVFDGAIVQLERAFMKPDGVMKVTVTNPGSGYTSPPTVVFSGGGGSGAAGTAVLSGNTVASVTITNCGSNYSSPPSVSFQGGGGANAAGTAVLGSSTDTSAGTIITFAGRVAESDFGRNGVKFKINSHLELLNVQMPRNLFQPACLHTLYDAGCTLSKPTFTFTGTSGAGATLSTVPVAGTGTADGFFALGTLKFTSGANAGLSRSVTSWVGGVATLLTPLPSVPVNGDAVQLAMGCDKQQATCGIVVAITFTVVSPPTVTLNATAHGLVNNQAVKLATTGTLPAPLSTATTYFVVNAAANTFQLSLSINGAAISCTTTGSGTHTVKQKGKFSNLDNFRGFPYVPVPETAA